MRAANILEIDSPLVALCYKWFTQERLDEAFYVAEEGWVYPVCAPVNIGVDGPHGQKLWVDLYSTQWIGPHTDKTVHPFTIGIVLSGDHVFYTGTGRVVGKLTRGSVYWLNSHRLHGVRRASPDAPPLVFAAIDYFDSSEHRALKSAKHIISELRNFIKME